MRRISGASWCSTPLFERKRDQLAGERADGDLGALERDILQTGRPAVRLLAFRQPAGDSNGSPSKWKQEWRRRRGRSDPQTLLSLISSFCGNGGRLSNFDALGADVLARRVTGLEVVPLSCCGGCGTRCCRQWQDARSGAADPPGGGNGGGRCAERKLQPQFSRRNLRLDWLEHAGIGNPVEAWRDTHCGATFQLPENRARPRHIPRRPAGVSAVPQVLGQLFNRRGRRARRGPNWMVSAGPVRGRIKNDAQRPKPGSSPRPVLEEPRR